MGSAFCIQCSQQWHPLSPANENRKENGQQILYIPETLAEWKQKAGSRFLVSPFWNLLRKMLFLGIYVNARSHYYVLVKKSPRSASGEDEDDCNKVNSCSLHLAFTMKWEYEKNTKFIIWIFIVKEGIGDHTEGGYPLQEREGHRLPGNSPFRWFWPTSREQVSSN